MSTKRILSGMLALILLLGSVPVTVLATEVPVVLAEEPLEVPVEIQEPAIPETIAMESNTVITEEAMAAASVTVEPYACDDVTITNEYTKIGGITARNAILFNMGGYFGSTSKVSWNFQGAYTSCSFFVGYVSGETRTAEMTITADGVSLYDQVTLKSTNAGVYYTIPLTGVHKLTIKMVSSGNSMTYYGVGNMSAILAGEAPSTVPLTCDEDYDATRISSKNVDLISKSFDMGGISYSNGYHLYMCGTFGYTSRISFAFFEGYKSMTFDLAWVLTNFSGSTSSALLTIEADEKILPGYDGVELKWDDLVLPVEIDLNGVTQLTITLESSGLNTVSWGMGNIHLTPITIPDAPTVTASNVNSSGKVKLTWDAVKYGEKYDVYRSTTANGYYQKIFTTKALSFINTGATPGQRYYYYVVAVAPDGTESQPSNTVSRVCDLPRPTGLKVTGNATTGKNVISWNKVDSAVKYQVWSSTTGRTGTFRLLTTTRNLSHTHNGGVAGTKYYYKVKAIHTNTNANSALTGWLQRTCDLPIPTGVKVTTAATGKNQISWNAVPGAAKYQVWVSKTGKVNTFNLLMTTKNLTHIHKGGVAGQRYYYKIKAVHTNVNANSAWSGIVNRISY